MTMTRYDQLKFARALIESDGVCGSARSISGFNNLKCDKRNCPVYSWDCAMTTARERAAEFIRLSVAHKLDLI